MTLSLIKVQAVEQRSMFHVAEKLTNMQNTYQHLAVENAVHF